MEKVRKSNSEINFYSESSKKKQINLFYIVLLFVLFKITNVVAQSLVIIREEGKVGYKDKATNKTVIPVKFTYGEEFKDGLAIVSEDLNRPNVIMAFKVINTKGEYISDIAFTKGENIGSGLIKVSGLSGGNVELASGKIYFGGSPFGIMNKLGKLILPPVYENIGDVSDNLIIISNGNSSGVIDIAGNFTIPLQTEISLSGNFVKGVIKIYCQEKQNKQIGLMDKTGKIILKPCESNIQSLGPFNTCGIAKVQMTDKLYGLISTTGKFVVEPKYTACSNKFNDDGGAFYFSREERFDYNCKGLKK